MSGWRDRASCAQLMLTIWDYDAGADAHDSAKQVCLTQCPVRDECNKFAHEIRPDGGIWAGVDWDKTTRSAARPQRERTCTDCGASFQTKPALFGHKRTHNETCRRGHDVTKDEAVYVRPDGSRACRECIRLTNRKREAA